MTGYPVPEVEGTILSDLGGDNFSFRDLDSVAQSDVTITFDGVSEADFQTFFGPSNLNIELV